MNKPPRASLALKVKRFLGLEDKQHTFVWCPRCGNELVSDPHAGFTSHGSTVIYDCGDCASESAWDFGPPTPILLTAQEDHRE